MAQKHSLLLIFVACIFVVAAAARTALANVTESGRFNRVCDPARFANFGLNMKEFPYCNSSLPYHVRAKNLVDQMTLSEKVSQLGDQAFGVARIGLPQYKWWSEALHGVADGGHGTFFDDEVSGATSFPIVILTAATFNESLWKKIGQAVSTEARAMYNLGNAGLTFWSPNINIVRDPRWGRGLETPGEDPYVAGIYAVNYVRGLQDVEGTEDADLNSRPLKVSACCKHYAAYDLENWGGTDRFSFDARVTEQDMLESFLPPFEMCIKDGDVSSVMCSYNRVNGIPACADPKLLRDTIRGELGLHGYIVSDCDAIEVMVNYHKYLEDTPEDAVGQSLKAGMDLNCGLYYEAYAENAVLQGKAREEDVDTSLRNLYIVLMRVGFFDGIPSFESLDKKDLCTKEHIELAADAARQGIVLLKNINETLPLDPAKFKNLALIGPHANATIEMLGNYAGVPCQYSSPLDGFSAYGRVTYEMGCNNVTCDTKTFIMPAVEAAKNADATILLVGLDRTVEGEGLDRNDLLLPGYQTELILQVIVASKGPIILVVMSGSAVDISFAKTDDRVKAILWAGYPGEEGGRAIADVVYGKYNPGGRLPITWYQNDYLSMLPMTSMSLRPVNKYPGRTYKFFNGTVVYPFGYGLSYTKFNYTLSSSNMSFNIKLGEDIHCRGMEYMANNTGKPPCPAILIGDLSCKDHFELDIEVKNIGAKDGNEVVLVYSKPPTGIVGTHAKQVIGFKRIFVAAGGSQNVKFEFNVCKSLGIVGYNAYKLLPSGEHKIIIGDGATSLPIDISFQK